jgi:hypothetical protein
MTPKEKAKELVNKYLQIYDGRVVEGKQCALIAVDEIIQAIRFTDAKSDLGYVGYWQEVKIEIEKL